MTIIIYSQGLTQQRTSRDMTIIIIVRDLLNNVHQEI